MRRGFLLTVLGFGALASIALIFLSPRGETTSTVQPGPTASTDGAQTPETHAPQEAISIPARQAEVPPARPPAIAHAKAVASETEGIDASAREEQREARVAARIAELDALSTKPDRASLETLLAEVRNPDPEIRQAALDALSQSGNRAAIPGLREAVAQTADAREKQAIEEVIEFMSLPTLTELLRGNGATNNQRPAPGRP